jgi:DNA polymerase-4
VILLVDMDAFFASVEQAHHPHLVGKPVIVCGDPSRRGVVTAASYEARPFGVRAGMPLGEARKLCPQAEYVEGNPEKYVALSLRLLDLYLTFSPDVEPFSVDEAFVGLDRRLSLADASEIAASIQREVDARFRLGASIGVGPNKLVAKMASGVNKPRGLTALSEEDFRRVFWSRDVQEMWGVGPRLAERMRSLGIETVGGLAHAPETELRAAFGVVGAQLREAAWGRDDTPLVPYHRGVDPKSMGHEVTLERDSGSAGFLDGTLLRLSDQVARRLRTEGFCGRTVTLKLRNSRFETRLRQRALANHTEDHLRIYEVAKSLLAEMWTGDRVRLIGVSVSSLERSASGAQAELFEDHRRDHALTRALDGLRDKLGEGSVVPAGSLICRHDLGHVPFGAVSPRRDPESGTRADGSGAPPARPTPATRRSAARHNVRGAFGNAPRVPRSDPS